MKRIYSGIQEVDDRPTIAIRVYFDLDTRASSTNREVKTGRARIQVVQRRSVA